MYMSKIFIILSICFLLACNNKKENELSEILIKENKISPHSILGRKEC